MNCEQCEYWKAMHEEYGECECDKFVDVSKDEYEDIKVPIDGIGYGDCDNYKARLYTGAKFGCIHFISYD